MSGSGFEWVVSPIDAFMALYNGQRTAIQQAILALGYKYASDVEAWMKANAPWTDRTGNARQGLFAICDDLVQQVVITFGHYVTYGKYLEFKNQGRFAIVSPALDYFLPLIIADVQALLAA